MPRDAARCFVSWLIIPDREKVYVYSFWYSWTLSSQNLGHWVKKHRRTGDAPSSACCAWYEMFFFNFPCCNLACFSSSFVSRTNFPDLVFSSHFKINLYSHFIQNFLICSSPWYHFKIKLDGMLSYYWSSSQSIHASSLSYTDSKSHILVKKARLKMQVYKREQTANHAGLKNEGL